MSEPVGQQPEAPPSPSFDETFPGCILTILVSEVTAIPFLLGFLGGIYAGYRYGADTFPGTGAEYALAILGGLVGIVAGFALVGAAAGAAVGGGIGWCLWSASKWLLGAGSDPLFWWPVYIGATIGGLIGFCVAPRALKNTVRWWRRLRAGRKISEPDAT